MVKFKQPVPLKESLKLREVIKNTTFADRLLFIFFITVSVAGIFITREAMSQGSDVFIEINGKLEYSLPLDINRTISVNGLLGNTIIEISGKKVRIQEAPCPNQICVHQGWVSKGAIVCLPGRIVVIVGGSADRHKKGIDAITG